MMRHRPNPAFRRCVRRAACGLLALVAIAIPVDGAPVVGASADDVPPVPEQIDPQRAESQAAVVAAEDRRITEVRTITSLARWQNKSWKTPYRLGTPAGYTLVLTPRSEPYTVDDLFELAPQTFLRMSDGSLLLTEHLVVTPQATLRLSVPGGSTLRLASGPDGFATIVSLGGELEFVGEQQAALSIVSWDVSSGTVDEFLDDGRAYIRAIGGQFLAEHVEASYLGFWSGRTGGIALTGTDRPNTGAITTIDEFAENGVPSLLDDVTVQPAGPIDDGTTTPLVEGFDLSVPTINYVSSRMVDLHVHHNAFGLFMTGANGVQIIDSSFTDNLLDGVVLHRYVTNGLVLRSEASRNVGHGFSVERATSGIAISQSVARANSGSGFSLSGRPLAEGPSATGASLRSYGNNSVAGSTAAGNGRHGIEVSGGFDIGLQNNTVTDHDMGIWVSGPARRISVIGNTVDGAARHGIALVDGITDATVTGNLIDSVATGVYLRDSQAVVKGNTVEGADLHGVTLVGSVDGSEVSYNVMAGSGPSALDTMRSNGSVAAGSNNVDAWRDTTPWYHVFEKLLQPMTALWVLIALLLLLTAIRGRHHRAVEHPYAHQMAHHGLMSMPTPTGRRIESDDPRFELEPV